MTATTSPCVYRAGHCVCAKLTLCLRIPHLAKCECSHCPTSEQVERNNARVAHTYTSPVPWPTGEESEHD